MICNLSCDMTYLHGNLLTDDARSFSHDAERAAASTTQSKEHVGVLASVGSNITSVGKDHLHLQHIINAETIAVDEGTVATTL